MMLSDGHGLGLWDHGWVGERKTIYDRLCTTKDSTWRSFEVLVCCDQVPARVAPQKAPSGLFLATADNNILRGGCKSTGVRLRALYWCSSGRLVAKRGSLPGMLNKAVYSYAVLLCIARLGSGPWSCRHPLGVGKWGYQGNKVSRYGTVKR